MVTDTAYHGTQERRVHIGAIPTSDHISTAVYATKNYSQFTFDARNRAINESKLERLYDAIVERNLLADNPILVTLDYVVLDGQHRLKVAEALEVPVYYHFASDTVIEDVPVINGKRTPWKLTDYLESWCNRGNDNYLQVRAFVRKFDWMLPQMAVDLCYYGDKAGVRKDFIEGRYQCNNLDFATKVAYALLDFRSVGFDYWKSRTFTYAVSNMLANSDYDHNRMMAKLKFNAKALRPAVTMEDYFEIFNEIYNYKTRDDNRVVLRKLSPTSQYYRADKKAGMKV